MYSNHKLLNAGDMNARIGNSLDYIIDDNVKYSPNVHWYNVSHFLPVRRSKDEIVDKFGRIFLELCKEIGIYVLNGRKGKDVPGDFTYICSQGQSVIDYIAIEESTFDKIKRFEIMQVDISNHFPLVVTLELMVMLKESTKEDKEDVKLIKSLRFEWQPNEEFLNILCDQTSETMLSTFDNMLGDDRVDEAVKIFTETMLRAVCKRNSRGNAKNSMSINALNQPVWWDIECEDKKRNKNRCLNKYRHSKNTDDLQEYKFDKNDFEGCCKDKKYAEKIKIRHVLQESLNNPAEFWNIIKQINTCKISKTSSENDVATSPWMEYFKGLLNQKPNVNPQFCNSVNEYLEIHDNECGRQTDRQIFY